MDTSITPVMFITANVGSIFENPTVMLKIWTEEFLSTVTKLNPKFIALHCQEVGGKNYEHSTQPVEDFVKLLIDSEELRLFDKVRVFLDEDFSSPENFTALGNFYFIHESIKDLLMWDFKEMNFCTVEGKEVYTGSIEHVPIKEKSKFPQDLFPECKWSRKGFLRTRWNLNGSVFDLVNIHLFHDASNFIAMETSPSVYSVTRQRALEYTLDRFQNDSYGAVPFFLFGDFNFRTNTQAVIERLVSGLDPLQVLNPSSDDVHKLMYRKEGDEVVLTLGKKEFVHSNHQQIFVENAGEWLKEYDNEKDSFDGLLFEFPISFPPTYPFEEDAESGSLYTTTRCPAWCDRVVLSSAAKSLIYDMSKEDSIEYELMGRYTCMGDHKPVYLRANLINKAGIIEQTLSNVVNPFMLVLCACKLKKILNWQHDKRSTLSSHVSKSTRLAVVEENGSLTLFPDIPVNTPVINVPEQISDEISEYPDNKDDEKSIEATNEFVENELNLDSCRKKLTLEKGQAEDLKHSKCDCLPSSISHFDSVHSGSVYNHQNETNVSDAKVKSKSESNLKCESVRLDISMLPLEDCSSHKFVPASNKSSLAKSSKNWKSCSNVESSKLLSVNVRNMREKEIQTEAETERKIENDSKVEGSLNVDSIIDSLDSDEALIVNVNRRTDRNELNETIRDDSSISSVESLNESQRISISKLKLNKLSVSSNLHSRLSQSQLCDDKQEFKAVPLPCLNHHYKRLVKRVHSASMIENKRTIVLKKTETCHCMTNSNEAYIDIFGDEYRTRSSSISAPNHIHRNNRRMKLISDPILKTSLPRLTSHHSSSDEEWYEHVLEAESPQKWLNAKNDPINFNSNAIPFKHTSIVSDDKNLSNFSTVDVISTTNHGYSKKLRASNEKLNFPSDCKLLIKLKRKKSDDKEKSCNSCNCCVIS